jgi:hypothetical protein
VRRLPREPAYGTAEHGRAGLVLPPAAPAARRPRVGQPGGQYGVSIRDSAGAALGAYRYLLFDVSRTSDTDRFGNTFLSEIDVDDGRERVAPPRDPRRVDIVFDTTEMPELQPWVDSKLRPVCEEWYPIIVRMLPSEGYTAPRRVTVVFRKDMQGVAATSGTRVQCAGNWFQCNPLWKQYTGKTADGLWAEYAALLKDR